MRTPKVFISHDIDKVEYEDFIFANVENICTLTPISEFFIWVHASGKPADQSVFGEIEKFIHSSCRTKNSGQYVGGGWKQYWTLDLPESQAIVKCVLDKTEKDKMQSLILEEDGTYMEFESDMLVSRIFLCHIEAVLDTPTLVNFLVPLIHYKYEYKFFDVGKKKLKVKNFIKNDDKFFQGADSAEVLEWDERFYIDRNIYDKMKGHLPIANPSPILHNWGEYYQLGYAKAKKRLIINSSPFAVHRFERVREKIDGCI